MGLDYALVHLKYTIPPGVILSFLYRPLCTRTDLYKIAFLITIAVVSTIPWDSYLIRTKVWTYPSNVIIGPKIYQIPAEEVFFFIIQTYNTTLVYLFLSKATFFPTYLHAEPKHTFSTAQLQRKKLAGQVILLTLFVYGAFLIRHAGPGTYLGLIIAWATPFLLLLWTLAYQFLLGLPWTDTVLPIILPTLYLWIVDTLALRRGTWSIESGTKLGLCIWPHLEIEEAIFFLVTNCLIVFGLVAFDNALAVLHTFTPTPQAISDFPSPVSLVKALLMPACKYDQAEIIGLQEAVLRLKRKSRSFYLASGTFEGKLRSQLIILYSFCRVADDLIDQACTTQEAQHWITKLQTFLDVRYGVQGRKTKSVSSYIKDNFPLETRSTLLLLPTHLLTKKPLYDLLKGFEMDLDFSKTPKHFPIDSEADLQLYGARVAGTVAQLCNELVFALTPHCAEINLRETVIASGNKMGIALQCVNIARDILVDAELGRVYIPNDWLLELNLTPQKLLQKPEGPTIEILRIRLLDVAFRLYSEARAAIEELPIQARGPIRVAVESYMEIGRVLREGGGQHVRRGRATVPKLRRLYVAWKTLDE